MTGRDYEALDELLVQLAEVAGERRLRFPETGARARLDGVGRDAWVLALGEAFRRLGLPVPVLSDELSPPSEPAL